jgi:hypothetical protein
VGGDAEKLKVTVKEATYALMWWLSDNRRCYWDGRSVCLGAGCLPWWWRKANGDHPCKVQVVQQRRDTHGHSNQLALAGRF